MKNQLRLFFSNLFISFQGHGWREPVLEAWRTRWTSPCTGCPSISGCNHTHTRGQCRKSESSKKTHATMGRVSNLHTDRGPGGNYCIFLISVVIRQHWTKWALFEDLLYMCLAKLLKFCHVHNGNNNSTYLIRGCNAWCSEHVNLGVLDIF